MPWETSQRLQNLKREDILRLVSQCRIQLIIRSRIKVLLKCTRYGRLSQTNLTIVRRIIWPRLYSSINTWNTNLTSGELDTAKKVWEAIKARHMGANRIREAHLQTLMGEFNHLRLEDTYKLDDFVGKLSEILSKSAALGDKID